MKNSAYKLIGNVVIVMHNDKAPSNEEWDSYVALTQETGKKFGDLSLTKQFVMTAGGGPSAAQRRKVTEVIQPMKGANATPVAVLSSSSVVRGIVTVFNWFNLNMKVFSPDEAAKAFEFLKVSPNEVPKIWSGIEQMKAEIAGGATVFKSFTRPL